MSATLLSGIVEVVLRCWKCALEWKVSSLHGKLCGDIGRWCASVRELDRERERPTKREDLEIGLTVSRESDRYDWRRWGERHKWLVVCVGWGCLWKRGEEQKCNCFTYNLNKCEVGIDRYYTRRRVSTNNQAPARTESHLRLTEVKGMANKGWLRGQFRANRGKMYVNIPCLLWLK